MHICEERIKEGRPQIQSWVKLKKYLQMRFMPSNYMEVRGTKDVGGRVLEGV